MDRFRSWSSRAAWMLACVGLMLITVLLAASAGRAATCTGFQACEGKTGTTGENACNGNRACAGAGNVGSNSCNADFACQEVTGGIGSGSCNGPNSCDRAGGPISNSSCNDVFACTSTKFSIADRSCNAVSACFARQCAVARNTCNRPNECKNGQGCSAPQAGAPIDCSNAVASAPLLNAQFGFLPEQIVGVTDTNGKFSVAITSITQDKPLAGGQGLCQDAFTVGQTAFLRSGRESTGGLVYGLGFTATDTASGDTCSGEVNVCVPAASQTACIDTGNDFNATQCETPPLGVTRQ